MYNNHRSLIEAAARVLTRDRTVQLYESILLTEDRIQYLKDNNPQIDTSHDTLATHSNPAAIIDHIAEHGDPTKNKQHTQWILGQYKKQNIRQEDMPRVHETLTNFEKYKGKLQQRDINQYKDIGAVEDAVAPHLGTAASKKEEIRQVKDDGAELIHSENGLTVHKLKTKEAAGQYGAGTKWCTAAKSNNMFDSYNARGPLYVVQKEGRKHQFHFESGQFMDEQDKGINLGEFIQQNPELKNVKEFKSKHPAFMSTEDQVAALKSYDNPKVVAKIIENKSRIPAELVTEVAKKARAASAGINKGETNPHYDVMSAIANPTSNAPADALHEAALDDTHHHYQLSSHPKLPTHTAHYILDQNMSDTNSNVYRLRLAANPSITPDVLERLHKEATDKTADIHTSVAAHPNTPQHIIQKYASGENFLSRHAALRNPNIDSAVIDAHKDDARDHAAISKSTAASEDTLRHIFKTNQNNDWIHENLAQNKSTPKDVLETLTTHPDTDIAKKAAKTLKGKK